MKEAETGLYCGPLRLLAMEVFDSVNQEVGRPEHVSVCCNFSQHKLQYFRLCIFYISCLPRCVTSVAHVDCVHEQANV